MHEMEIPYVLNSHERSALDSSCWMRNKDQQIYNPNETGPSPQKQVKLLQLLKTSETTGEVHQVNEIVERS